LHECINRPSPSYRPKKGFPINSYRWELLVLSMSMATVVQLLPLQPLQVQHPMPLYPLLPPELSG
jgi:hypothetical protein